MHQGSNPNAAPSSTTELGGRLHRPARALIGWLPPELAYRLLVSNRGDVQPTEEHRELVRRAHEAVGLRPEGIDQNGTVSGLPPQLEDHVEQLRQSPSAAPLFAESWTVALVDLTQVCAFQPTVFIDSAEDRVRDVHASDLPGIAAITLPLARRVTLPLMFNELQRTWSVVSPNPNLRVAGPFSAQIDAAGGVPAAGFMISLPTSFLQVAQFDGRHFLRDGYHRALGFLKAGISQVPAFVRVVPSIEQLVPAGMLPQAAYMGCRPPVLPDYLDDSVAATVQLPAVQKMVIIHALEVDIAA